MNYTLISLFILSGIVYVQSQCPPKQQDIQMIIKFLERSLESIRKTKPGTDPKDADYVINRLSKDIVTNKKYSPCNDEFRWEEVYKDAKEIRADCYKPSDFTTPPAQKAFMDCAKKFFPQLVVKYGTQAIGACQCFGERVIPNWESKYKKYAAAYVDEFRTLKHRKK